MSTDFELSLLGGQMRLVELGQSRSLFPDAAPVEYPHAQAAVERALAAIAEATGRMKGDDVDEPKLVQDLQGGALKLVLKGHQRELHVAALHLHVRFGLDIDGLLAGGAGGVSLAPIPDAADGYATYRFDSDMRPLEAMRGLLEAWLREAEREPQTRSKAQRNKARWSQLLTMGSGESAPVRVVVTGVTGAGKSTFLNGLLGRDLVPYSSGVCTAAVLRLRHAASPEKEAVVVNWRSVKEIKNQIASFKAEAEHLDKTLTKVLTAGQRNPQLEFCRAKEQALTRALEARSHGESLRTSIASLPNFARNDAGSVAEAVQDIEVFVAHPLLEHVEIVDAPGLRDGNEERQKMLVRAFEGDTAWLYLVPAASRDESCRDDWKHIKNLSNNDSGVLVLTKADGQPPNPGDTLDQAMERRLTAEYAESYGWTRPTAWCSALLPARLAALKGDWTEQELTMALEESKLGAMMKWTKREPRRRLDDFLDGAAPLRRQVFSDYALDASRLPRVMRKIGNVLYEDAIAKKVKLGQDELTTAAQEALEVCANALSETEQVLSAHDAIAAQRERAGKLEKKLREMRAAFDDSRERQAETLAGISEECDEAKSEFDDAVEACVNNLETAFDKEFTRQSKSIYMSGGRSFSLVENMESPLSALAHDKLKKLASSTVKTLSAESGRKVNSREIRPEQCVIASTGVTDVEDEERFFELASTTYDRMWAATQRRATKCAKGLKENFREEVKTILKFAKSVLAEDKAAAEARIESAEQELEALERSISENNPAHSRQKANERLAAYQAHKAAFEKFLAALKQ